LIRRFQAISFTFSTPNSDHNLPSNSIPLLPALQPPSLETDDFRDREGKEEERETMMIQQSYLSRRPGIFHTSSDSPSSDAKSPSAAFWMVVHGLCCLISLLLGYRFSLLVFFFLFTNTTHHFTAPFRQLATPDEVVVTAAAAEIDVPPAAVEVNNRTRVVVGRHGIRIRPWPHPDPVEVMKAHRMIETVQKEQRMQFGVKKKNPRTVIVVTPTYVRTFQTLHLTGVVHSLMLVPYDVVWIVVEAGGVTNETASIVSRSGLKNTIHVGVEERMPNTWEGRHRLESQMRIRALRVVREKKLDGIVMFADDSNMHSMELFDEIQNVNWFGAVSLGILTHNSSSSSMAVQGPACNASDKLSGWQTFDSQPYKGNNTAAVYIDDAATVLPRNHEWAGFVLNSRLLWKEDVEDNNPSWVRDLESVVDQDVESPLSLLKDSSMVEPLGSCGRQVLLWWVRVEARFDSKFPPGWMIDPNQLQLAENRAV
ncbi:Probable beta-1,4-xylosyltransferase IRX14H, partial [Linum grandiflorum]